MAAQPFQLAFLTDWRISEDETTGSIDRENQQAASIGLLRIDSITLTVPFSAMLHAKNATGRGI